MKVNLLAVGKKMPSWVTTGFNEYATRLPREFKLTLTEVTAQKRTATSHLETLLKKEGDQLLAQIPKCNQVIALDRLGNTLSTEAMAAVFSEFYQQTQDVSVLIGGPEGLSADCLQHADKIWSLSALTLPHPLVRVLLAEQIYRIWSILCQHPYHR